MYRKEYKEASGQGETRNLNIFIDDKNVLEENSELKSTNSVQGHKKNEQESLNTNDDFNNNNLFNDDAFVIEKENPKSDRDQIIEKSDASYFHFAQQEIENEQRLHSVSCKDSSGSPEFYNDHYVINADDQETFQRERDSAYQSDFNNASSSAVFSHRPLTSSRESCRIKQRRRSSSLSSIPAYFYPDPYSIVVSRYLEDLGSLSSYSSTAGSEATEYLQLSQATSPVSTPDVASFDSTKTTEEERKARIPSGFLLEETGEYRIKSVESLIANMNFDSALSTSEEYQSFRSSVPLRKICVESDGSKEWKVYDAGPKSIRTPLLCLGPACATSDVFYKQILNLTARGMRVISVEGPVYWTVDDWCKGLKKLLDCLNLDKVHIFGASLGGFLAQKFAEYTYHYSRVASLILCNTFLDTSIFDYHDSAMIFWMLPSVILKKLIVENITAARIMDLEIAHAIEFMIERLNKISQQELSSRMTLNCVNCHVDTFKLKQIKMTIMDVFDDSALSSQARDDIYRNYTDAKLAHLKSGGNFPYLSRSDDVSMHILVHLRAFNGTKHSAQLEDSPSTPIGNGRSSIGTPISTSQANGNRNAEDVFGTTGPESLPTGSLEDKNQAFKEKAASVLGMPVQ